MNIAGHGLLPELQFKGSRQIVQMLLLAEIVVLVAEIAWSEVPLEQIGRGEGIAGLKR